MSPTLTSLEPVVQKHPRVVNVAVAVIYYQDQYLLGYRNSGQHQGDRYEFVGGKIDSEETATAALIRETAEETGIDISANTAVKLGRLHHDYGDKQVCLQVYKVALTAEQYQQYKHCDFGLEGQALTWVDKPSLVNNHYPLPAANQTILTWLKLPEQITITQPLAHFKRSQGSEQDLVNEAAQKWLAYHQPKLPSKGWCYLRLKTATLQAQNSDDIEADIIRQLLELRADISVIIPYKMGKTIYLANYLAKHVQGETVSSKPNVKGDSLPISAYHLTHNELMIWFTSYQRQKQHLLDNKISNTDLNLLKLDNCTATTGLIVSCHDSASIKAANQLAQLRLLQRLAPVIAIFLSPVLATNSHPDSPALGWQQWSALAQLADMPVIALGGLAPTMLATAIEYGASSVAGISSFLKG